MICSFYLIVAARTIVRADPSLRYTIACCRDVKYQLTTDKHETGPDSSILPTKLVWTVSVKGPTEIHMYGSSPRFYRGMNHGTVRYTSMLLGRSDTIIEGFHAQAPYHEQHPR